MNVALASRLAVSPYARRLARERNLPLDALRGSGPRGRILAADVLEFVPVDAPVEFPAAAAAPAVAASSIAAFSTSIALGALHELLAALWNSGKVLDIDDILLRAAGCAAGMLWEWYPALIPAEGRRAAVPRGVGRWLRWLRCLITASPLLLQAFLPPVNTAII